MKLMPRPCADTNNKLPSVLKAVKENKGLIEFHKLYSQVVTSILTMGTGGSAGLEAPIAITGAAWGSNVARWLKFDESTRQLLLACGAAAGKEKVHSNASQDQKKTEIWQSAPKAAAGCRVSPGSPKSPSAGCGSIFLSVPVSRSTSPAAVFRTSTCA